MTIRTKLQRFVLYAYYPLLMLHYYLAMHGINIYSFVMLPLLIILIFTSLFIISEKNNIEKNLLFVVFLFYNILSIINYLYNGRPVLCYTTALRHTVFPMIFYLFAQDEKDDSRKFYHYFLYSCIFCFVIGLYLYVVGPDYYKSFLMTARENVWYSEGFSYDENRVLEYSRMSSFFGFSYDVCFFSIPALIISLMLTLDENEKLKKWQLFIFAIICWISSILCFHRIAMVAGVLFMVFFFLYSGRKGRVWSTSLFFILIILLIVYVFNFLILSERGSAIYDMFLGRTEKLSFSVAMSERAGVTNRAINAWDFYILGGGIGSFSHIAMRLGYPAVTDNEYVRILTEYGLLGTLFFTILIINHLFRGIKEFKTYGIEVCIILFYLSASIGANALSLSYVFSPVFWYALGHIQNKAYKKRFKNRELLV